MQQNRIGVVKHKTNSYLFWRQMMIFIALKGVVRFVSIFTNLLCLNKCAPADDVLQICGTRSVPHKMECAG